MTPGPAGPGYGANANGNANGNMLATQAAGMGMGMGVDMGQSPSAVWMHQTQATTARGMSMGMGPSAGRDGEKSLNFSLPADGQQGHQTFLGSVNMMGGVSMRTPKTMTGKQLVERTLNAMALPPDEWANEFKDLTGQLVEALEQLHARETELAECAGLVAHYEGHLAVMRQQTAMLYADHLHYANEVDEKDNEKVRRDEEGYMTAQEADTYANRTKVMEEALRNSSPSL